jgi:hypothetical protein
MRRSAARRLRFTWSSGQCCDVLPGSLLCLSVRGVQRWVRTDAHAGPCRHPAASAARGHGALRPVSGPHHILASARPGGSTHDHPPANKHHARLCLVSVSCERRQRWRQSEWAQRCSAGCANRLRSGCRELRCVTLGRHRPQLPQVHSVNGPRHSAASTRPRRRCRLVSLSLPPDAFAPPRQVVHVIGPGQAYHPCNPLWHQSASRAFACGAAPRGLADVLAADSWYRHGPAQGGGGGSTWCG